jgi:flotillin
VTRADADREIVQMRNDLRRIEADLSARIQSEEERTAAAAREARAIAEKQLQEIRAELESLRLQAETVLPSEAAKEAEQYRARGRAALIRERGQAVAEALELLHTAWEKAGPNAKQIALIEDLEKILAAAADGVQKIQIGQVSVIDNGDGSTLPSYISAYPQMLNQVFEAVDDTVGISITDAISGRERKTEEDKS